MRMQKTQISTLIILLINSTLYECATPTQVPLTNADKMLQRGYYKNVASVNEGAVILKDTQLFYGGSYNILDENSIGVNYVGTQSHITVRLAQIYSVNNIFMKVYDYDEATRYYDFEVYVSENNNRWDKVYKNSKGQSWVDIKFPERRVKYIKFVKGLVGNTLDDYFHLVKLQVRFAWA